MLLESDFINYGSRIRRKAYNIDSPVQAQRNSGLWMPPPPRGTPGSSTHYGVDWVGITLTPSCATLARGYQYIRPTVLL